MAASNLKTSQDAAAIRKKHIATIFTEETEEEPPRTPDFKLVSVSEEHTLARSLAGMFDLCLEDQVDAYPTGWGEQGQFSVFDEERALGTEDLQLVPITYGAVDTAIERGMVSVYGVDVAAFHNTVGSRSGHEVRHQFIRLAAELTPDMRSWNLDNLSMSDASQEDGASDEEDESDDDEWAELLMEADIAKFEESRREGWTIMKQSRTIDVLEEDSNDRCPICVDSMLCKQTVWRLPCSHQMHDVCARRFFRARPTQPVCPLCRCDARLEHVRTGNFQ